MWLFLTAGMFFVTGSLRKNAFYLNLIGRIEPAGHPGDNNHVRLRSGNMFPRYSGPFVVRVNNVLQPQRAADPARRAVIPRHPGIAIQTAAGEPEYDAKLFRGGARLGLLIRSASARLSCSPRAETSKIVARSVTSRVISASENGALRAPSAFEVSVTVLSVQSAGEIHVLIPSDANCSRVPTSPCGPMCQ